MTDHHSPSRVIMIPVNLIPSESEIFWGEIAPCEHLVQIYERDDVFLDSLEGFVAGGLRNGDGVIIIATPVHLQDLDFRLRAQRINVTRARFLEQYVPLGVDETLAKFMVNGWPDSDLFHQTIIELLTRARKGGRSVRAFGEMVAVLWAQGHRGATVQLEHLWHDICQSELFSLFCAYPRTSFTKDMSEGIQEICSVHSRVVEGAAS